MARLTQQQIDNIARAVADPRRFDILKQIAGKDTLGCSALREKCCISAATISHHIKELEQAGLISTERDGKFVNLTFERDTWNAYLGTLSSL